MPFLTIWQSQAVTGPTPVVSDSFTGSNGSAWANPPWTTSQTSGTGGSATIQGNAGQLDPGAGSGNTMRGFLSGMTAIGDMDVYASFMFTGTGDGRIAFTIDSDNTANSANPAYLPQSGYILALNLIGSSPTSGTFDVYKTVSNSPTVISTSNAITLANSTQYRIRSQRIGTVWRFKVWATSGSEPGTWLNTYTDTGTQPSAGKFLISSANPASVNNPVSIDDVAVYDPNAGSAVTTTATIGGDIGASTTSQTVATSTAAISGDVSGSTTQQTFASSTAAISGNIAGSTTQSTTVPTTAAVSGNIAGTATDYAQIASTAAVAGDAHLSAAGSAIVATTASISGNIQGAAATGSTGSTTAAISAAIAGSAPAVTRATTTSSTTLTLTPSVPDQTVVATTAAISGNIQGTDTVGSVVSSTALVSADVAGSGAPTTRVATTSALSANIAGSTVSAVTLSTTAQVTNDLAMGTMQVRTLASSTAGVAGDVSGSAVARSLLASTAAISANVAGSATPITIAKTTATLAAVLTAAIDSNSYLVLTTTAGVSLVISASNLVSSFAPRDIEVELLAIALRDMGVRVELRDLGVRVSL